MTRQEVGRVNQRAPMVLLSAQRRSVPEIAASFDLRKVTVRLRLHRFDIAGPAGLYDAARSGRPRKVTAAVRDTLATLVTQDPAQLGYMATLWTVAMLVLALTQKLGVRLSRSTLRSALPALGFDSGPPPADDARQSGPPEGDQVVDHPTYCSHLDPVEPIWLHLKGAIAANRLHGSMTTSLEAVERFFTDMTAEQARVWTAA
jgi:transposase